MGRFELSPDLDRFHQAGFVEQPLIVFPRNPIWIEYEGGEAFVANNGCVNFYNPDQVYRRSLIDPAGDLCYTFSVRQDLLAEICFEAGLESENFDFSHLVRSKGTFELQMRLLNLLQEADLNHQDDYLAALEELSIDLIHSALCSDKTQSETLGLSQHRSRHLRMVESIKSMILEDLATNWSLSDIAGQHYISEFHLCRLFKRYVGQGLSQFRSTARLRAAAFAVMQGNNLAHVACDFGFANHSHLTTAFRRYFGCTPSEYSNRLYQ